MLKRVDVGVILIGAFLIAVGYNLLIIPHHMLSGGVSGISMIIGYLTHINIGALYLVINLPLLVWGWILIGKRFILLSILSVASTAAFMQLVPVREIAQEPLIGAVFGGVLIGIGTGISLRWGGSTGGFDILGSIITRNRDFPLGSVIFALNGFVVFALAQKYSWDLALNSMLSMYITSKIVDTIHIRHIKVTAYIVTKEKDKMKARLIERPRGVTMLKTEGAFTGKENTMFMTVTTRYELAELRKVIREVDPRAFVNIVETVEVMGDFRRLKQS